MDGFFLWLEATAVSEWLRESTSVFVFPTILSVHAIGMGLAVGVNAALALRLLGVAPRVPMAELKSYVPVMWTGFWLNAISGVLLLLAYPTKAFTNPMFYLKLALIGAGMGLFVKMSRRMFVDEPVHIPRSNGRLLGAVSLLCWALAITAGRLLAYTATRILASHG
jgi:hypothetical protein